VRRSARVIVRCISGISAQKYNISNNTTIPNNGYFSVIQKEGENIEGIKTGKTRTFNMEQTKNNQPAGFNNLHDSC
jgi:hypothetical protein